MGDYKPCDFGVFTDFIVFRESPGVRSPGKRSFNNPSLWRDFPFFRLDSFRDITDSVVFVYMLYKRTSIAHIAAYAFYGWICFNHLVVHFYTANCVMDIRCVDCYGKKISHCVCYYMPFASFRFFPPSIPRPCALYIVLVLCESMIPYDGSGFRPASVRLFSTRCARIRSHRPFATAR